MAKYLFVVFFLFCLSAYSYPQKKTPPKTDVADVVNSRELTIMREVVRESIFCNVREYVKGNVSFVARPIEKGNNYRILCVGTPKNPYVGLPALKLKLPGGTVLDTSTLDGDHLKTMARSNDPAHEPVYDRSAKKYDKWPVDARRLTIGPWVFILHDEQLVSFSVYYRQDNQWRWPGYIPSIGLSGTDAMFEFPLKQEDVLRVFGQPEIIREYLEE